MRNRCAKNRIQITGKETAEYLSFLPKLKEMNEAILEGTVIETGPGLSQYIVDIAVEKMRRGEQRPIIIEPLDYDAMADLVDFIETNFPSRRIDLRARSYIPMEELKKRLAVYRDEEHIEHYPIRMGWQFPDELSHLKGKADFVIDLTAAGKYSPQANVALQLFLKPTGELLQKPEL